MILDEIQTGLGRAGRLLAEEHEGIEADVTLVGNSATVGEYFKMQLTALKSEFIHEVRGKGLMIAVELTTEAGGARQFCEALKTLGILCKETHDHIIRFSPPLVLTNEQVDWAMERIAQVFLEHT